MNLPVVARDARFRAGRTLVQRGQCEQATDLFATLLEESIRTFGAENIETVPAYYEYGNALFRSHQKQRDNAEQEEQETGVSKQNSNAREAAAAAAERRVSQLKGDKNDGNEGSDDNEEKRAAKRRKTEDGENVDDNDDKSADDNDDADAQLALEMMETSWSVLDNYIEKLSSRINNNQDYFAWCEDQTPRILTGIGDVLSSLGRHADAVDVYCRALARREGVKEALGSAVEGEKALELLKCRRLVVEVNVLIAEEILACPPDRDVVTTETKDTLVSAAERVDYARGYYDKARDELQEAVLLMGDLAAKGMEISESKEDICYIATLVMAVGTTLAEIDDSKRAGSDSNLKIGKGKKMK